MLRYSRFPASPKQRCAWSESVLPEGGSPLTWSTDLLSHLVVLDGHLTGKSWPLWGLSLCSLDCDLGNLGNEIWGVPGAVPVPPLPRVCLSWPAC